MRNFLEAWEQAADYLTCNGNGYAVAAWVAAAVALTALRVATGM